MGLLRDTSDPAGLSHAPLRQHLSLPSGTAGTNLGKTARDAGENREPLHYGSDTKFREGLAGLGLAYVVGVQSSLSLWRPGEAPLPPKPRQKRGRPPKLLRRSKQQKPVSVRELVREAGENAFRRVRWREGGRGRLESRFWAVRVRPAHRDYWRSEPHAEPWLLAEWPRGAQEPTKYWLSNLPAETPLKKLVELAKHRWIVERDYLELKQELGLGHFEGRSWRGFHHHATLCIAAYGFLVAKRSRSPLSPCGSAGAPRAAAARELPATGRSRATAAGLIRTRSRACGRGWRRPFSGSLLTALFAAPDVYDTVVLRQEPDAGNPLVRICGGGYGQP